MKRHIANVTRKVLALVLLMFSCNAFAQELTTVPYVDLDRYVGKWYDIASFPQRFQKGCACTMAKYTKNIDGTISVTNTCNKDGKEKIATAKAKVVDAKTNAKLSVQFFWPFKGKYWIIDLADDYSYAVVGHPNRKYLWILSRTPVMDATVYQQVLNRIAAKGFDLSMLQKTPQDCNNWKHE